MTQLANLVLADGQGTPVNHTFSEQSAFPLAMWSEKTGIAIGEARISISQSRPSKTRRSQKTVARIEVPILETISGDAGGYTPAPRVAYTMWAEVSFVAPDRSTTAQRSDLFAFTKNLLAQAMVKGMIVDQSPAS